MVRPPYLQIFYNIWPLISIQFSDFFYFNYYSVISSVLKLPSAATLGYDPLWFAMMFIVVMQTSFLTPPFAYSIFYLKGMAPPEVNTGHIYRGVVPFIILQFIGVALPALFPQ